MAEGRDPVVGTILRCWLDHDVSQAFEGRVLPVDGEVARRADALHIPGAAPIADALVAATALVTRMALVTRNVRHYERFPRLRVINPWTQP